jgi:hypothetical protein
MRTQTILLVRDTVVILGRRPIDGEYRFVCPYHANRRLCFVVARSSI